MKYFMNTVTNIVCAFEEDGSQDHLITEHMRPLTEEELYAHLNPAPDLVANEEAWVLAEIEVVADQLLKLEDEDPTALPGTDRQWRNYRIAVRAWVEGAVGFPDSLNRPVRPA